MPNAIERSQAEALIQEQLIDTIQQDAPAQSVFMSLARKLPNMTSATTRMPVLDALPMSYWVNGDTGFKTPSSMEWDKVYLNAEELAVIVPIPENVVDDASFDIMGEVQPRIIEAIGQRIDQACLFGLNKPASWPKGIAPAAIELGQTVTIGSDLYDDIMGDAGVIAQVEETGRMVTGAVAAMSMRGKLRGLRTTDGAPIFKSDMQGSTQYALDGAPLYFPQNGAFTSGSKAMMIVGDWSRAVYSIRQDVTVKILTEGVIHDPSSKELLYNLPQQDMIALRVKFRMGWALPNPVTLMNSAAKATRKIPFAVLQSE